MPSPADEPPTWLVWVQLSLILIVILALMAAVGILAGWGIACLVI